MTQDPNYQDQGSLDQPQQPVEAQPGAYQTPGVVPPDQQPETVDPESMAQSQQQGGGAAPTSDVDEVQPEGQPAAQPQVTRQNTPAPVQPTSGSNEGDGVGQGGEVVSD